MAIVPRINLLWTTSIDSLGRRHPTPISSVRLWRKVDFLGPSWNGTNCWLWNGGLSKLGYGRIWDSRRRPRPVHQVAWELTRGPIPAGLEIDHLCKTRNCVNPAHLEPVTHKENVFRGDCVSTRFAARTHCSKGHPLIPDVPCRKNCRRCRICRNEYYRELYRLGRTKRAKGHGR